MRFRSPLHNGCVLRNTLAVGLLGCLSLFGAVGAAPNPGSAPANPEQLYTATNVWTIHLTFTPDQWEAMEPAGGNSGPFGGPGPGGPGRGGPGPGPGGGPGGGPRGPGGPGGQGGPRGPGGGGFGFGPSMFLAPTFMTQGDLDKDGRLSREEFAALGEKWFTAWNTNKSGSLNTEQIRDGLNATMGPPQFGPPGGGGGGGGRGPGGPGGGGGGGGFFGGRGLQGAEGKRNGVAAMIGVEFNFAHADLDFGGQVLKDVGVRYKGNGTFMESRGSLKRSLKVEVDKYVKDQKFAGITTLNLHNNVTDVTEMNEPVAHRLFRDAGVPAPRTAYARVYVTVPGKHEKKYLGLYSVVEDIDKPFMGSTFGSKKGSIFKPVTPSLFSDLGDDWAKYNQTYDPKGKVPKEDTQRVIQTAKFVTHASDTDFAAGIGEFIDLESFARYLAVITYVSDIDGLLGPGQNYYLHLDSKTRRFAFVGWDQDHSWGQFPGRGSQEQRENLNITHPWQGNNAFLDRIMKVDAFKQRYLARMEEFSRTLFRPERFDRQIDELAAIIRPAIADESAEKLAGFDQAVAGKPFERPSPFGGGRGGFGEPVKPIKAFVRVRTQSIADQLAGKSAGMRLDQGGPGGPGGGGRMGPGNFLSGVFMNAMDGDKNGSVAHEEFTHAFAKWFSEWTKDAALTDEQLRAGIDKDLAPRFDGPPGGGGGGGFGRPGGGPPRERN